MMTHKNNIGCTLDELYDEDVEVLFKLLYLLYKLHVITVLEMMVIQEERTHRKLLKVGEL